MKKLLLFSFLFYAYLNPAKAQVPQNDLIENATLVTSSFFEDSSLRLDLTTASSDIAPDCNVQTFNMVYYKFTANTSGTAEIMLTDQTFNTVGQAFVIAYSAPNLNVTNENQFTNVVSECVFGTSTTISTVQGQSYYVLIHRADQNAFSRITFSIDQTIPNTERSALINLYNATNGPSWTTNTNWNTNVPESQWHGITVDNGHVTNIDLFNNNLEGSIPSSITDLVFLQELTVRANHLSGLLPDLSTISTLQNVDVQFNDFSFADLETNFQNNTTITEFLYQQQNLIDEVINIDATLGQNYNLTTSFVNGTGVNYQWYRSRPFLGSGDEIINGATSNVLSITNAQESDIDSYTCYITSNAIPDLTLVRNPINLRAPVSTAERNALIALYNATNGANWDNNTNWLSSTHVGEWRGVTTTGNKVTRVLLNFQNLDGELPDEIGDLVHLKELRISVNPNLTGDIPSTIGNLTELKWLRLQFNGMSGELPASMSNLTSLERLYLQSNAFSGSLPSNLNTLDNLVQIFIDNNELEGHIPDFTGVTSLLSLGINNNKFQFGDFEDEFSTYQTNLESFAYIPQDKLSQDQMLLVNLGDSQTLHAVASGNNNQYQWFFNNTLIPGATNATLELSNLQNQDFGIYKCAVTNTTVTDLTLETGNITIALDPTQHPDYNALIALYNATNGANWTNNTNWLDPNQPISSWHGITEVNGRVSQLSLFNNNLNGNIPSEIGDFTELAFLQIAGNPSLTGSLPDEITNLTNLQSLAVYNCGLRGEIPSNIGNLANLTRSF